MNAIAIFLAKSGYCKISRKFTVMKFGSLHLSCSFEELHPALSLPRLEINTENEGIVFLRSLTEL
jgi:hypothetical protein